MLVETDTLQRVDFAAHMYKENRVKTQVYSTSGTSLDCRVRLKAQYVLYQEQKGYG